MSKTKFTHLHVHSHYSLLDGLSKIDEIVMRAKEHGLESIALTDHGNLYGAIEFYKKAKAAGIKPILGVEAYVALNGRKNKGTEPDKKRYHLILLAKNLIGWKNLLKLVTFSNLEGFYYKPRIDKELLEKHHEGLICLSACIGGEVGRFIKNGNEEEAEKTAKWYKSIFKDDYYLEIQPHSPEIHESILKISKKLSIPVVATQDSHYINKDDQTAHEILLAIQTRNPLEDEDRLSLKEFNISMGSPEEMEQLFKHVPEAITNTQLVADKCNVELELGKDKIPEFPLPEGETAQSRLKKLAREKLKERYPKANAEVKKRLEHELNIIEKTGFANYFLIVQDIISWAKIHGIIVGPGRGSAAGSLVSYVIGITNIDPLKYELLFERFLNPDRNEMPDIDIDFADTRRDEVIAYVREKYGDDKVAQIITFGTMMARAAIRDTGRALGLPYGLCDKLAKMIPFNNSIKKALKAVPDLKNEYESDKDVKNLIDLAKKLEGTVRHASVHACGIVISPEPLINFMPVQRAPQGVDTIITQFEMHSVEDLGILKLDFLGLKNLTIIENALRLIKENRGETIDINNLPEGDKKTFELLQQGETTGVFQLESSGMTRYLKELKPTELEDIIVMISLYRPGPMDLIPMYLRRKFGEEDITYIHPKLEPILSKTYGVGVYQEQMMRIARDLAGFTLAEADILRKAIGKKIKKLLDEQKEKLIKGMIKNGIDEKTAEKIWDLFPPFARYGFNRSHAASYATISYQTAYLKTHYPVEFMTSLLNTSGDIDRINFLVKEARRLGIEVLPPDINSSSQDFTIDENPANSANDEIGNQNIRFGLLAIKNLGSGIVEALIEERARGGPFENLTNLLTRIHHRDLNKKSIESLIKCGALDSLGIERSQALENIDDIVKFNQAAKRMIESSQESLFGGTPVSFKLKPAQKMTNKRESLLWEKELLGLYLTDHPFSAYEAVVKKEARPIKEVVDAENQSEYTQHLSVAGIVTGIKSIITKNGDPMLFVTLEDQSDNVEVLVFSNVLSKNRDVWTDGNAVIVNGRLSWRDGEAKLICNKVREL